VSKPNILFCITVYNGRQIVPRAIESALRLDRADADYDILVLDDASPEPGWSEELATFCRERGVLYYRTPRNLGIPRNVNLGLLAAVRGNYDHVVINNSDVIFPKNLLTGFLTALANENVGSVTAWSNNVSIYSLPNADPDRYLANQDVIDWVSATLAGNYGGSVMDVPAGISFAILIPTPVIRDVGLMDPVFGRGYCEETDWSLRSLAAGYRIGMAPGVFVYHQGRGSNLAAGIVANHATTVPENEAVVDMRYPMFRQQVDAFVNSGLLQTAHVHAAGLIIKAAGVQFGYTIEVGWLPRQSKDDLNCRVLVSPEGETPTIQARFRGFETTIPSDDLNVASAIRAYFGKAPHGLNLLDRGGIADQLRGAFTDGIVTEQRNYPTRV
jgi:GT2 family glycosyltransferase